MSFLLCIVCLIWLYFIQQKLDKISKSIDFLSHNDEKAVLEPKQKVHNELITQDEVVINKPEPQKVQEPLQIQQEQPNVEFEQKYHKKDDFELQNAFLGNIFNKIGAIAIIVALIIFIKLVSPFFVITPLIKTILGFLSGFVMIGGALHMHKSQNLKRYSEVLLGTGFATLFITTFCAYSLFHLCSTGVVLAIGALLLILTFILAQRMQTASMLVIGLIGGYLTPCFSGSDYEVSMWYLIFLNAVSLIFTLKNTRYKWINLVNLLITMFAFIPYVIDPVKFIFPVVLWGIYILYDILRDKSSKSDYVLSVFNYIVLTLFSMILFRSSHAFFGYMLAVAAMIYYGLGFYSYVTKNELYKTYVYYILLNLWLEIVFLLNGVESVISLSLVGLALALFSAKFNRKYLNAGMYWYLSMAFIGALFARVNGDFVMFTQYIPVWNFRTLVFMFPVVCIFVSSILFKKTNKNTSDLLLLSSLSLGYLYVVGEINSLLTRYSAVVGGDNFNKAMLYSIIGFSYVLQTKKLYRSTNNLLFNIMSWIILPISLLILFVWSIDYHTQAIYLPVLNLRFASYAFAIASGVFMARWMKVEFFKYLAVILGFVLVYCESAGLTYMYSGINYIISLSWVLYSGAITIMGILLNKRYLINSGIALVILSIFRIFIFDLAKVEALYKLIAFLALGVILMLVSYIYNFHKNSSK